MDMYFERSKKIEMKISILQWVGLVTRMEDGRNAFNNLYWKILGKRSLGRPRYRWKDNISRDLAEIEENG